MLACAEYRHCPDCGDEQLFEQLSRLESGCTSCGTVLVVGFPVPGYTAGDSVSQAA